MRGGRAWLCAGPRAAVGVTRLVVKGGQTAHRRACARVCGGVCVWGGACVLGFKFYFEEQRLFVLCMTTTGHTVPPPPPPRLMPTHHREAPLEVG